MIYHTNYQPAKSSASSLSAAAAPFDPTLVDTTTGRNATTDYLTHLAKEADARYAANAQHHPDREKGACVTAATVLQVSDLYWVSSDIGKPLTVVYAGRAPDRGCRLARHLAHLQGRHLPRAQVQRQEQRVSCD